MNVRYGQAAGPDDKRREAATIVPVFRARQIYTEAGVSKQVGLLCFLWLVFFFLVLFCLFLFVWFLPFHA